MPISNGIPRPDPAAVKAWLGELPLGNADAAKAALAAILEAFNAYSILPGRTRLELSDLIRRPLELIAEGLVAPLAEQSLPYGASIEEHGLAGRELHALLAQSYGLAAAAGPAPQDGADGPKWQEAAFSRAFTHWGQVLLINTQLYRAVTAEFWRDVYALFDALVRFRAGLPAPSVPLAAFKRIVLFQLANPFRLRQREMISLYGELGSLTAGVDIRTSAPDAEILPEFCFIPAKPMPPMRFAPTREGELAGLHYLYTRKVARALLKGAQGEVLPDGFSGFSRSLMIRVARTMGGVDRRKFTRIRENNLCRMVVGLQELAEAFVDPSRFQADPKEGGAEAAKKFEWSANGFELMPKEGHTPWNDADSDTRAFRNEATLDHYLLQSEPKSTSSQDIWQSESAGPRGAKRMGPAHGEIINSGARGYCVTWKHGPGAWIRAGELIAITAQDAAPFVGVIRWLAVMTPGPLRFGVELLTPQAEVVELLDSNGKIQGRGLLLPEDAVLRPEPELLLPAAGFRPKAVIMLRLKGKALPVRLKEMLESTAAFTRFSAVPVSGGTLS